jgi:erythromycin esterase
MRSTSIAISLWLILGTAGGVIAPGTTARAEDQPGNSEEGARVAWLKKHVAPLRSIDPGDEDFSDLEPVRKAIGDARIVFLSEELHGTGATFHARTRLIKFLHQRCGFDVLAFESGLYDCRKVWELLREGKMPALDAANQGIFRTWTGTEECRPVFEYLGKQARQARPLEVCGFDCQFTGPASRRFLPEELTAFLKKLPPDSLTPEQRETVVQGFKQLAKPKTGIGQREKEALAACRKALADSEPSESLPAAELAFWGQFLDSSIAMVEVEAAYKAGIKTEGNHLNLRDVQMAKNLVWLARQAYPKRKIMVWAAAYHLMRKPQTVAMVVEPGKTPAERKTVHGYAQGKIRTMGDEAWKDPEKESYSIFFTAAEGEFQDLGMTKPHKLAPLIPGSLEDLLVKAGSQRGFLDLRQRGADGKWLEERLVARVLGDMDHEADWTQVCDGMVFTRKQFGVSPVQVDGRALKYHPVRDPAQLGVPFDRYTTRDGFDRTVTYYLSRPPARSTGRLPVALFIQGSGCDSVFSRVDDKVHGGLQNLLLEAGKGRLRVLVVEKPGVAFGTVSKRAGSAEGGSAEFRREHTLPRWVEAVNAALRATHRLEDIDWTRTLVVGHSEGGIVAAHLASSNPLASHVALLAGGGPTQLFDLCELASQVRPSDHSPAEAQSRVAEVRRGWAKVQAEPDSADKLWLGHPHRRWASFLKTSTLEGLLGSRAPVFAAHGTADQAVPVASFDLLRAELTARGRDLVASRLEGRDHAFRKPDDVPGDLSGPQDVFGRVVSWYEQKRSPIELAIKRDMDRMQGTWQMVALNLEGEPEPLDGPLANLQVIVTSDHRTVQAGEVVYARARYRINPLAEPPTIDVIVTHGGSRGQTMLGIYELNGRRLRVCLASGGRERPRDFCPKAGSGHVLQKLEHASS